MPLPDGIRAVLLDIEGTTTPISFVHDVLFPFAQTRLREACGSAGGRAKLAESIALLRAEHTAEAASNPEVPGFGDGAEYAEFLMDEDRKSTGLKALQGLIWKDGYRDGTLLAPMFSDVEPSIRAWRAAGIRLRIYSSGSVQAQKLLFKHSEVGDLTGHFEGYHDTTTGPKKDRASYQAIANAFELEPNEILFLSDVVDELDAAVAAGLRTGLLERPGNPPQPANDHSRYSTFDELR
jgi:enolase-phosphatase E1